MFIYNVTNKVSWTIHDAWVQWMKEKHIPEVLKSGCFTQAQLVRILDIDDAEGPTYAAQYQAADREEYDRYIAQFAPALRDDAYKTWGDQFIAFRTLMQIVP